MSPDQIGTPHPGANTPPIPREIRLHFLDRGTALERPFVTDGTMSSILELNWWFAYLRTEQGASIKTNKQYAYTICDYYRYCEVIGVNALETAHHDLVHYFDDMQATRGVTPNTINTRARTVGMFYHFLKNKRFILRLPFTDRICRVNKYSRPGNVAANNQITGMEKRPNQSIRTFVQREELGNFIKSFPDYRNRVIADVIWATGLRIEEVVELTKEPPHLPSDLKHYIRHDKSWNAQIVGKGQTCRLVEVPSDILRSIQNYIENERPKTTQTTLLFLDRHNKLGRGITTGAIQAAFRDHSKATGVLVTPHMIRHAFALERLMFWEKVCYEENKSKGLILDENARGDVMWYLPRYRAVKLVQLELGHKHVSTTEIYLKHLDRYKATIHGQHKLWMQQLNSAGVKS
jgi:site-specific recombinase XerD